MLAQLDLLVIGGAGILAVLGVVVVDLWLLATSCRALVRRDWAWGLPGLLLGLLILGVTGAFSGVLATLGLDLLARVR